MKRQLCFPVILLGALVLGACSSGRKQITQNIDYFNPTPAAINTPYEFTSYEAPALTPSVTSYDEQTEEAAPAGEDEDFTSEAMTSSYGLYGDVVVSAATHKFKLGASATRHEMSVFQQALEKAYLAALNKYRPSGFTYSMSSIGRANPLSDIEVTCKMSENAANQVGQDACNMLFKSISTEYVTLLREAR